MIKMVEMMAMMMINILVVKMVDGNCISINFSPKILAGANMAVR